MKLWLEPLTDGSLPSLDIQTLMFDVLEKMPIDTHQYFIITKSKIEFSGTDSNVLHKNGQSDFNDQTTSHQTYM